MKNELKYLLFIVTTLSFLLFVTFYYFSDKNKKNFFLSYNNHEKKISDFSDKIILKSDTDDIIEYVENNKVNDKKRFNFWELLFK